jgi:putative spermidine/putrescine transport system ATP-binding protein
MPPSAHDPEPHHEDMPRMTRIFTGARAPNADTRGETAAGQGDAVGLRGVRKEYGLVVAVDDVDLQIRRRELFTLLGPSGSGKTTILRLIAGLIDLTAGEIFIDGEDVSRRPTWQRNIGVVFQSLALFPHMDVFDNVAFPLRMRRVGRAEIRRRVAESLDAVRLPDLSGRAVHELSGGQRQRVALARALVYGPRLLLLDEPLGSLDKRLREEMQLEIVRLHREIDVTIINVTHDQREALMLSDRIGVMREGRLEQVGGCELLYRAPRNRFVAEFLGNANLIAGTIGAADGEPRLELGRGFAIPVRRDDLPADATGRSGTVVLRAEDLELAASDGPAGPGLRGRVLLRVFEGSAVYYEVKVAGIDTPVKITRAGRFKRFDPGEEVVIRWLPQEAVVLIDPAD